MWDVFISHAWEDKESIARPLADELRKAGLNVWYDEFSLTLGDSLRRSIDNGLSSSRFGIVILSPAFFSKKWPQKELDGLTARETAHQKIILPIWHQIDYEDVLQYSPTLADKLAVSTSRCLSNVIKEILQVVKRDEKPDSPYKIEPTGFSLPENESMSLINDGQIASEEDQHDFSGQPENHTSSFLSNHNKGIISTLVAVILCGFPGLFMCIFGAATATGSMPYNTELNGIASSGTLSPTVGFVLLCLSVIFIVIPIAVGFFMLRKKPEAVSSDEPIPPVS